jgi:hypothetical protein
VYSLLGVRSPPWTSTPQIGSYDLLFTFSPEFTFAPYPHRNGRPASATPHLRTRERRI